jgi:hypothetical protein
VSHFFATLVWCTMLAALQTALHITLHQQLCTARDMSLATVHHCSKDSLKYPIDIRFQ